MPYEEYLQLLLKEIQRRSHLLAPHPLKTLYFGGGTPSLVPAEHIVAVIDELAKFGFPLAADAEVTIEINPATVSESKLNIYLENGINRFSVGAQTFDDALLKSCGRKHNSHETRETLNLLRQYGVNFSFDLLFALPHQSLKQVQRDIDEALSFSPNHLSAYCLTLSSGHPMQKGRPPEDEQLEMFRLIEACLKEADIFKYEISNFSKSGFESKHNLAYWTDQSFWGLGLSAHSYLRSPGWGQRFWNPKSFSDYQIQVEMAAGSLEEILGADQIETLTLKESLTDFCHTHLRLYKGLDLLLLESRFGKVAGDAVRTRIQQIPNINWLEKGSHGETYRLTSEGQEISNQVFSHFLFSPQDGPLGH